MGNIGLQLYSVREAAKFMGVEQEDFDQDAMESAKINRDHLHALLNLMKR